MLFSFLYQKFVYVVSSDQNLNILRSSWYTIAKFHTSALPACGNWRRNRRYALVQICFLQSSNLVVRTLTIDSSSWKTPTEQLSDEDPKPCIVTCAFLSFCGKLARPDQPKQTMPGHQDQRKHVPCDVVDGCLTRPQLRSSAVSPTGVVLLFDPLVRTPCSPSLRRLTLSSVSRGEDYGASACTWCIVLKIGKYFLDVLEVSS